MTSADKDKLIELILQERIPGCRFVLSESFLVENGIGMGDAIEVILELEKKGFVSKIVRTTQDCIFNINSGLETFAQRGGFKVEDVMFQAELERIFLEISKLESEVEPSLYKKIMNILEPLAKLAGIANGAVGFIDPS